MFKLKIYDRNGTELKEGDIVKISKRMDMFNSILKNVVIISPRRRS